VCVCVCVCVCGVGGGGGATSKPYFQGRKYNLRAFVSILRGIDLRWAIALAVKRRNSDQGEQKFGLCTLVTVDAFKISL
jgi:hypothetical protein